MTLHVRITKKRALIALPFIAIIVATAAYGALSGWFWQVSSGNARGQVAAATAPTADAFDTQPAGADSCVPGGTCSVTVYVSNPNPYPLYAIDVDVDASTPVACSTPDSGATFCTAPNSGCTLASNSFAWNTSILTKDTNNGDASPTTYEFPTPILLAANASHVAITVPNLVKMSATAPKSCGGMSIGPNEAQYTVWLSTVSQASS